MAAESKAETSPKKKSGKGKLIVIIAVIIAVGAGAGVWFMRRTASAAQSNDPAAATTQIKSVLHLENFIVNISGTDGSDGYLRVGIELGLGKEMKEGEGKDQGPPFTPKLRDTILNVLAARHMDDLLTADGKEKLKQDLLKAIIEKVPAIDCREVYFTEFLVQR